MSFLSEYMTYVDTDHTDPLWKKWVALTCMSAAVGRKVWLTVGGRPAYANTYALLVGEPAAGKGVAMSGAQDLLPHIKDIHLSSDDTNVAVAVKQLAEASVSFSAPDGSHYLYNSLVVLCDEFGVFLPEYDRKMMNALQKLYDAKSYNKETLGRGEHKIENSYFVLLGACTPSYLQSTIPEEAWTQGFMSRTVPVYGRPMPPRPITEDRSDARVTKNACLIELRRCAKRHGRIRWHPSGITAFNEWILSGLKPAPTHPRLHAYNGRRNFTTLKLSLLLAIDRDAETIEACDVHDALAILFETEERIPEIFKQMKTGGDQQVMKELLHYMAQVYVKKGNKPLDRSMLVAFLANQVPAHAVDRMILVMEAAGAIKLVPGGYIPTRFAPGE